MVSNNSGRWLAGIVAVFMIALDQISKLGALRLLHHAGQSISVLGPVDLTLVFNHSNAFGIIPVSGDVTRWALVGVSLIVAGWLIWMLVRRPVSMLPALGTGFLIAGAIGNALDRIRIGTAIDFLDASKLGFVWVFNLADASIDIGIALWLLDALLAQRPGRRAAA
jgi:signal peptidase II